MDKQSKKIIGLFSRYIMVLLLGVGNLYLFYKVLTPITVRTLYWIVSVFTKVELAENVIYITKASIEIVPACVAGAAYYLLFALVMLTDMKYKVRMRALITAFTLFFCANLIRLLVLTLFIGSPSFELIHWVFWHLISTLFVVGIWFSIVKIYKIKSIPIYSDFKYIGSLRKPNARKNSGKKGKLSSSTHKGVPSKLGTKVPSSSTHKGVPSKLGTKVPSSSGKNSKRNKKHN